MSATGTTVARGVRGRIADALVAAGLLLLAAPLLGACALVLRLEGGPGVLTRHVRRDRRGLPVEVLAFRTTGPATRPRPVGRCVRALSLDLLPQLWDVLRGRTPLVARQRTTPREDPPGDGTGPSS